MAFYALYKWYSPWSKRAYHNMVYWYSEYVLKTSEQREWEQIERKRNANIVMMQFGIMNMICGMLSPHYGRW